MSNTILVQTSTAKNYELHFGFNLSDEIEHHNKKYSSVTAFALVDAFVLEHHKTHFESVLRSQFPNLHILEIPRGEEAKRFEVYQNAVDFVLQNGVERGTPLFAIGGGVTGDLAGFVAATVLRGIPLVHIPTTLLAMVDSSIGGKTGINHATGKNLVGSFYQPDAVFADVAYLKTLERKEWVNGLSEVLKYGMIHSPEILEQVNSLVKKDAFKDIKSWLPLIQKSAQIKTDIVAEDVLEAGKRAYLNFGHTFGHVIENEGSYSTYSHGEGVYAGMIAALHASNALGSDIELSNLLQFKSLYNFSLGQLNSDPATLVNKMRNDKKVKDGIIHLILLKSKGQPYIHKVTNPDIVEKSWQHTLNEFS
ncbi:3-dehydroquinate synthase [Gracilimonas sp.]|uniref:3-dehydroquinate synthase n=1 Tax=Gracilimonas sp. TaxID=1974203 RepID=UPI00287297D6|nr:3-dehydroquinate synthase [Gracilimonas sp.]